MAPKRKPKKTKEELEQERLQAEEAARLLEEERLRQEEEERQRLAELERQRQELLTILHAQQTQRLAAQQCELQPLLAQLRLERAAAGEQRQKEWEWARYLSCSCVAHPRDRVAMSDLLRSMGEVHDTQLKDALLACQDCYTMLAEGELYRWQAVLAQQAEQQQQHEADIHDLHELVGVRIDRVTAHTLQHADEHANDKGEIQVGLQLGSLQWALWVNTSKNPRLKAIELAALHMVVEVPKQIALANIAMRVQLRERDEFFTTCSNEYMAIGPVLYADLLALPPPAKHVKQWVLRQVTPLASNVSRMPYPIPPAGADPATYKSEEEPPPLGFTYPYPQDLLLLDGEDSVQVGWWDSQAGGWSTAGVTGMHMDTGSGMLSFRSTHMGALAVVQSRTRLLPYTSWTVRPTGGRSGSTAAVTLHVPRLPDPLVLEVGPGWVCLLPPTCLPALGDMAGLQLPPEQLLLRLSARGLHLLPEDRDAVYAGVTVKDTATEVSMCEDLALVAGACLIARSKWNQAGATHDECIVRLSEITDWEAGGRTEARHLERIFSKEKEEGERRVLSVIRRGPQGVAFCDALDKREAYCALPGHESLESVQQCMSTVMGEVHASVLTLLQGTHVRNGPPTSVPATPREAPAGEDSQPELEPVLEGQAPDAETDAAQDSAPDAVLKAGPTAEELLAAASAPVAGAAEAARAARGAVDPALAARLCVSPESLELMRTSNAMFTQTLAHTLRLLRVFSFS